MLTMPTMASSSFLLFTSVLLCFAKFCLLAQAATRFNRDDFPSEFVFGAGTSAYQYEGEAAEDGRTPSIWDTFVHAGKIADKSKGDVSVDGYHKYKEDVKLMSDTGLEAYRFSIYWSRLLPSYDLGTNNTLNDTDRINYLSGYTTSTLDAIRDGSDVRGYFVWSFMDVFEFVSGYKSGFGLYYVDFLDDDRKRQPKLSVQWYSNFLTKKDEIHIQTAGLQGISHTIQSF